MPIKVAVRQTRSADPNLQDKPAGPILLPILLQCSVS
jgi:hypothetical protein